MKSLVFAFARGALHLSARDNTLFVSSGGDGGYRSVQQAVDTAHVEGSSR
jgi:hypothetical protein